MTPETETLVIQMLQSISNDVAEIKQGMEQMGQCLDRIERCIDRITRQLAAEEGA